MYRHDWFAMAKPALSTGVLHTADCSQLMERDFDVLVLLFRATGSDDKCNVK